MSVPPLIQNGDSMEIRQVVHAYLQSKKGLETLDYHEMQQAMEKLKTQFAARVDAEFLQAVYNHGMKRGRDLEFRTAQEHEQGMKKLKGSDQPQY